MIELDFFNVVVTVLALVLTILAAYFTYNSYKKFTPGEIKNLSKWVLLSNVYLSCYLVTLILVSLDPLIGNSNELVFPVINFIGLIFIIIASTCIIKAVLIIKNLAQEFGFNK